MWKVKMTLKGKVNSVLFPPHKDTEEAAKYLKTRYEELFPEEVRRGEIVLEVVEVEA